MKHNMSKKQKIKKEILNPKTLKTKKKIKTLSDCQNSVETVNDILDERSKTKHNTLKHCDSEHEKYNCGCDFSGNSMGQKTDLIVLIDTSGSMKSSASKISQAVERAIDKAKKECEPDLRLIFLGVDGTWSGTSFTQSHREYITRIHGAVTLQADEGHVGLKSEQGANAIEDLSKFFDWRSDACKAIFYISDEELDSISPRNDFANETAVTKAAIAEANTNKVTVFAHHLTYQNLNPQIKQNYIDLCHNTGGKVFFSNAPNVNEYIDLLTEVICNSCGISVCKEIELPEVKPCVNIKWGDSKCDCLESSDVEVMTVTVCNSYTNIKFKNLIISSIEVVDSSNKPVPMLPNGTPSLNVHPIGVHCFGDLGPCTSITREFVLITKGVKQGKYKLMINGVCFDISIPKKIKPECFEFDVCKD